MVFESTDALLKTHHSKLKKGFAELTPDKPWNFKLLPALVWYRGSPHTMRTPNINLEGFRFSGSRGFPLNAQTLKLLFTLRRQGSALFPDDVKGKCLSG